MKVLILLILKLIILSSCSSNQTSINARYPSNTSQDCLTLVKKIIDSPENEADESVGSHYKNVISEQYKTAWSQTIAQEVEAMWKLKELKSEDIKLLEFFGFAFESEFKLSAPSLETFIKNYTRYLDLKNIPEEDRIYPALVYKRSDSYLKSIPPDSQEVHGSRINKKLKRLIFNPSKPPKEKLNDWTFVRNPRLSAQEMQEGLAEGIYPLFSSGVHDIFHFIVFVTNPEYAKIIKEKNKALLKTKLTKSIISRSAYTLELLSLANPEKLPAILKKITIKNPSKNSTFEDFYKATLELSNEEVKRKANDWIENYKYYITPFSAAGRSPHEKLNQSYSAYDLRALQLYFINEAEAHPMILEKPFSDEMFIEGMNHMDTVLNALLMNKPELIKEFFTDFDPGLDQNTLLRMQIARIEYALWKSATSITLNQWAHDILNPKVDINSPTMNFIRDCFGKNSLIYNIFGQQ